MNAALTASIEGERLDLVATGAWTAELERLVDETAGHYAGARAIDIDLGRLECIDTFGAWLIERLSPPLRHTARPRASSGFRRPIAV